MAQLIRRQTCFRMVRKQREDLLFQTRDLASWHEVRRLLQPELYTPIFDEQRHPDNAGETASNCKTTENQCVNHSIVGYEVLTKLCRSLKHSLQQKCVQLRHQKYDCYSSNKDSLTPGRTHTEQSIIFHSCVAKAMSKFCNWSEPIPEFNVVLDTLKDNCVSRPTSQNLHGQLLKSNQLSSSNILPYGYRIKVKYPMQSHLVNHYSVGQISIRYFLYPDNKSGRLLSVHHPSITSTHYNLFSSLAVNNNSSQMRQSHILNLEPVLSCSLKRGLISKNSYNFPELKEEDLEESYMRGSGAGGQAVAKTNNCVVLLHKPTGIQVKMHVSRSLEENRKRAREKMVEKLDFHFNGENSFAEQKKAEKRKANKKMKKKAELVREKMKQFREGLNKNENGPDVN
ncbi:uncharacterized protein LOC132554477 isoform X1 [Ylistrum balloti]|uniref:uncharacterized protein LOC132554477 isoform X1 n=1 Tax=Ylistrum balloti TaxID=509963 RepID=UPI002905BE3E|nr:uncharacterized protein LOC132554477 isoform X1 [Ylistrum balloti]